MDQPVSARVTPEGSLDLLSQYEVDKLRNRSQGGLYEMFRRCALAVLNCGSYTDDCLEVLEAYRDFEIQLVQQSRGIKLEVKNAPPTAFVDGEMIKGIKEHLFAVLRDLIYSNDKVSHRFDFSDASQITNAVFHMLRHAKLMQPGSALDIVVCWGGHSISRGEYDYTKTVGYELGLRTLNICTGCGPGAMKGPMKGATIAHAKQRILNGRYIGITEPGIIAAEAPNPIVNQLVILPDIEKRLEAFVRLGHGIIVFPGGVGTTEEILYLLGILLHPDNAELPLPLIFTGPSSSADYFLMIDKFIGSTLGPEAQQRYEIIIDNPEQVARTMHAGLQAVSDFRRQKSDAYYFNWMLRIAPEFQLPFKPNHQSMASLNLSREQPPHKLAAALRCAFSGIVAGNVKEEGIKIIAQHGPFEIRGNKDIMDDIDQLLNAFVAQQRMKLGGRAYHPSYKVVVEQ